MELVNSYFPTLLFTKVEQPDDRYVLYAAIVSDFVSAKTRQAVVLSVPSRAAIKQKAFISELPWVNLQTRHISDKWKLPRQTWSLPRDRKHPDVNFKLNRRETRWSDYSPIEEVPLSLLMMHNPKKTKYQWHSTLKLSSALASFWCVISHTTVPTFHNPVISKENTPLFQSRPVDPPRPLGPPPRPANPLGWQKKREPVEDFIEFIE